MYSKKNIAKWGRHETIPVRFISLFLFCLCRPSSRRETSGTGDRQLGFTSTRAELTNPKNDATDVSAALKGRTASRCSRGNDLDKSSFDRTVRDFVDRARVGAEVGCLLLRWPRAAGRWVRTISSRWTQWPKVAKHIDFEMVRVDVIHRAMERQTNTNILFLDACRDNPLARNLSRSMGTRSSEVGRGLAAVESGIGTLISYSTQPGNVALDGTGAGLPHLRLRWSSS